MDNDSLFQPDGEFPGQFYPWCEKCKRYYSGQHVCDLNPDRDQARNELVKWLGGKRKIKGFEE